MYRNKTKKMVGKISINWMKTLLWWKKWNLFEIESTVALSVFSFIFEKKKCIFHESWTDLSAHIYMDLKPPISFPKEDFEHGCHVHYGFTIVIRSVTKHSMVNQMEQKYIGCWLSPAHIAFDCITKSLNFIVLLFWWLLIVIHDRLKWS